jgi:hypothetical protein
MVCDCCAAQISYNYARHGVLCGICHGQLQRTQVRFEVNNPNNEPVGPFTGRCSNCGSQDLYEPDGGVSCYYECRSCGKR